MYIVQGVRSRGHVQYICMLVQSFNELHNWNKPSCNGVVCLAGSFPL